MCTWLEIPGRVVVGKNDRLTVALQCGGEYQFGIHVSPGGSSGGNLDNSKHSITSVQEDDFEGFDKLDFIPIPNLLEDLVGTLGTFHPRSIQDVDFTILIFR